MNYFNVNKLELYRDRMARDDNEQVDTNSKQADEDDKQHCEELYTYGVIKQPFPKQLQTWNNINFLLTPSVPINPIH